MSENIDIEIIQVVDPWNFQAREKPHSARSSEAHTFQKFHEEMNQYCREQADQGTGMYTFHEGEMCAALSHDDGLWHRVRIERIISQHHGQQACCYVVDDGSELALPTFRLVKLPEKFQKFPHQVHKCCLWGIQPVSMETLLTDHGLINRPGPSEKWDEAATEYMVKMIDASRECKAEIVHRDADNTYFLRLYLSTNKGTVCFNDVLIKENYAVKVRQSTKDINSRCERLNGATAAKEISPSQTVHSKDHCPQSLREDMPPLVSNHHFRTDSSPDVNGSGESRCSSRYGLLASIDNKVPQQLTHDNSVFSIGCNPDQVRSAACRNSPDILPCSKSLPCSHSNISCTHCSAQNEEENAGTQRSSDQKHSVTQSVIGSEAFVNFSFGRGRGLLLAKSDVATPQSCLPGLHHAESQSYLTACGSLPDTTSTLPATQSSSVDNLPSLCADQNTNHLLLESAASKSSKVKNSQQQNTHSTSASTQQEHSKTGSSHDLCSQLLDTSAAPENKSVLKMLKSENGSILARELDAPLVTRQDQPISQPLFGVVVHGKGVPSLICDVVDVPFRDCVKSVLMEEFDISVAKSNQAWVWPAALGCRHVIGISPPGHGKTMSYVPAVISHLLDQTSYIELPHGKGPITLIVVPSWKKAQNVFEIVEKFTDMNLKSKRPSRPVTSQKQIRPIVLYAGGTEDSEHTQISLMEGCEVLISTPHSLIRLLEKEDVSFKRLCHVILDDAHVLATDFVREVDTVMQLYKLQLKNRRDQRKCQNVPRQIMIFASRWNKGLEMFHLKYTREPIIAISSRVEAAVYGCVRQIVTMTKWEQRLAGFCGLLDTLTGSAHRVVAFTQDASEAVEMSQAAKSRGVYCLLIHEALQTDDIAQVREQWLYSSKSIQLIVMVCTDQCYQDLAITNATMVVHYGLPDSKTKFGNRLACMCDYFCDRTSSLMPEIEPVSQILLTDRCGTKVQDLFEILQRSKADYPPQLVKFIKAYQEGIEKDERKVLCPFLKSFGACNHGKCGCRHQVIPSQDLKTGEVTHNSLPASGEVKVKVIHVENASHFYCHLIEHRSVPDNVRTDLRLKYQMLVLDMIWFFNSEKNHECYVPSDDPFLDGLCAFKDDNGTFHRAKVLASCEASKTAQTKYRLWLVDAGCEKVATVHQLLKLPRRLAEVPYQAVEVYLCSVKPMDNDSEWTDKASIFLHNLVHDRELVGRIVLRAGLALWLGPLVHQVAVKSVGLVNDINIRHELLENKYAAPNPDHIQKLYELYRGKTEISETLMRQYFDYVLEMEMRQETLTGNDQVYSVNIAAVISPGLFYVQKWENFELLEKLETRIMEMMNEKSEEKKNKQSADAGVELSCGSVCLAQSSDGRWYRAKIMTSVTDGEWQVFFLDYGDTEKLSKDVTVPLPRELAELPCQAIECQLAYIQPTSGEEWSKDLVDVLCDLAFFVDGKKKELDAKVVDRVEPENGIGQKLVVDLYDTNAGSVRFSQELVHRRLAECAQDSQELKPLLGKPALQNQKFFIPQDKVLYLCANIYWSESNPEAVQQADELCALVSSRDEGWDTRLAQRGVIEPLIKVLGYIQDCQAHGMLLDSLVSCCLVSSRIMAIALTENLPFKLMYCLEQVSRPSIQLQAAQAVSRLVCQESFCMSLLNESCRASSLVSVVGQLLIHCQISADRFELFKSVCSASTKMVLTMDKSFCSELVSSEMIEHILSLLKQASADHEKVPWLELLAAIATWESTHTCLMREAHITGILCLLKQCVCEKCLYYLLSVCQSLVQGSRRHKRILIEAKLLLVLNNLVNAGLRSPALEVCQDLQSELTLTFPQPEHLQGVPAHYDPEICKITCPHVTWSQNCFRIRLIVKVRNSKVDDFSLSESRISCCCTCDGVRYELDWELYDSILPHKSKVVPHASYAVVSFRKQTKGKWSRLLKQKVKLPSLSLDFEHPYDSDDEDVEDAENSMPLTRKRDLLHEECVWKVENQYTYHLPDESSDELAVYSHSSDSEPTVDTEFLASKYS